MIRYRKIVALLCCTMVLSAGCGRKDAPVEILSSRDQTLTVESDSESVPSSETEQPAPDPAETSYEETPAPEVSYAMPVLQEDTQYDWLDVSIVIMNTILTKPDGHVGEPSAALFGWNDTEDPVLFTGYKQEDGQAEYTIYTFKDTVTMEIGQCTGIIKINLIEKQIAFNGLGSWEVYRYDDHQMVRVGGFSEEPAGFIDMHVDSLQANIITAENIRDFIQ